MYDKGKEAVVYFSMSIKLHLNLPYVITCSYVHSTEYSYMGKEQVTYVTEDRNILQ